MTGLGNGWVSDYLDLWSEFADWSCIFIEVVDYFAAIACSPPFDSPHAISTMHDYSDLVSQGVGVFLLVKQSEAFFRSTLYWQIIILLLQFPGGRIWGFCFLGLYLWFVLVFSLFVQCSTLAGCRLSAQFCLVWFQSLHYFLVVWLFRFWGQCFLVLFLLVFSGGSRFRFFDCSFFVISFVSLSLSPFVYYWC